MGSDSGYHIICCFGSLPTSVYVSPKVVHWRRGVWENKWGGERRKGEWGDGVRGRSYEIHSRIVGRALVPRYDLLASPESESATARLSCWLTNDLCTP